METEPNNIALALSLPFSEEDLEWKISPGGCGYQRDGVKIYAKVLTYVTNRAIQDRLDLVLGVGNWKCRYRELQSGSFLCGISLRIEGEWVEKWDGADKTDIEATKGGISNASKRTGSVWGIGRYLYDLPDQWANVGASNDYVNFKYAGKFFKDKKTKNDPVYFRWNPPKLLKKFLP